MFKPQDDSVKPWPKRIQDNGLGKNYQSSYLNSDTLHYVNNLSSNCNDPKIVNLPQAILHGGMLRSKINKTSF